MTLGRYAAGKTMSEIQSQLAVEKSVTELTLCLHKSRGLTNFFTQFPPPFKEFCSCVAVFSDFHLNAEGRWTGEVRCGQYYILCILVNWGLGWEVGQQCYQLCGPALTKSVAQVDMARVYKTSLWLKKSQSKYFCLNRTECLLYPKLYFSNLLSQ